MDDYFGVTNTTKSTLPIDRVLFANIKDFVLGKKYELSLVFVTPQQSHKHNLHYRQKDKPTNILSFPLDNTHGEIIICPQYAKKEAVDFDRSYPNYLIFLFIHGLVHLKGFDHGSRMETEEVKIRNKFQI